MRRKLLLAYATRTGSTTGIAEFVADILREQGEFVDVLPVNLVMDLSPYWGVIVGSSIRSENWLPEALSFLEKFNDELHELPVALFTSCISLAKDTPKAYEAILDYSASARYLVEPVREGYFAGRLVYDKLVFPLQWMIQMKNAPEGDFRDWEYIRDWTLELHDDLLVRS